MKVPIIPSAILLAHLFLFTGCDSQTTTTPASTDPTAHAAPSSGPPRHGGVLKKVATTFPKVLGYPEEFTPIDSDYSTPALERLVSWDAAGNLIPVLAESWDGDPEKKTITWHLRKGIFFTDGTRLGCRSTQMELGVSAARRPFDRWRFRQISGSDRRSYAPNAPQRLPPNDVP